jgi:1-acyl-sn-glycerol-3-phosphate acyltransferase
MTFYSLAHLFARLLIVAVARAHIEGTQNLKTPPPYILSTNHLTSWDPPLIFAVSPVSTHLTVLAAEKWRRVPPIRLLFNAMGAIWVKRGEVDRVALRKCIDVLAHGGAMGMSPEGTRSRTGSLQKGPCAWIRR